MNKETFILPGAPGQGCIETEWPFTELGKILDIELKRKGFNLQARNVSRDDESDCRFLFLGRVYESSNSKTVEYNRTIILPDKEKINEGETRVHYSDFQPEEVTWIDDVAYIPLEVLADRLKNQLIYSEQIFVYSRKNCFEIEKEGKELIFKGTPEILSHISSLSDLIDNSPSQDRIRVKNYTNKDIINAVLDACQI